MDESSLRAQLNKLDALRSSLHSSFRFWDWIVVIGVALELIVLVAEYCDEWLAFWRATIRLPERPKTWLFVVGFCGILMVAGGIAEELSIDSQIEGVETQIKGLNEQLFGIVSSEAESASTQSQLAKDKSTAADTKADTAQEKSLNAEKKTVELSKQTVELTQKLEAAGIDLKKAKELADSIKPRVLGFQIGPNGKTTFDELKPFAGVNVTFEVLTDAEPRRAAQEIENVLGFAGWKVAGVVPNPELYTGFFDGVGIWYETFPSGFSSSREGKSEQAAATRCRDAAIALEGYLISKDWKLRPVHTISKTASIVSNTKSHPIPS
jgi:hypothetical protein